MIKYFFDVWQTKKQSNLLNELSFTENITNNIDNEKQSEIIIGKVKTERMLKLEKLQLENSDIIGWIEIENTNINYPVVQTSNNEDYLHKAFDGSKNEAGWIFADYRNNMQNFDKNTIIYGHSRLNKTMFGSLFNVLNENWYKNKYNQVILFSTPTENTMWQTFSVYKIDLENYYLQTNFTNDKEYVNFLTTLKDRSKYAFNVNLDATDKIITLSTCSDVAGTGRIVLHAKLIKREKRI